MTWHLVSPNGNIVRSTVADSKPEARFRLAPIPPGHFVANALDHAAGYLHKTVEPPPRRTRSENAKLGMQRLRIEHPDREAKRKERISLFSAKRRAAFAKTPKGRIIQANIRRGLARLAAKRQQDTE
jgi:hypothetical protein